MTRLSSLFAIVSFSFPLLVFAWFNDKAAIIEACTYGQHSVLQTLVSSPKEVNWKSDEGSTPLHYAAHSGSKKTVEVLLRAGANIDATDGAGDTSLIVALKKRNESVAIQLIKEGASIFHKNSDGYDAQYYGLDLGDRKVASSLLKKGISETRYPNDETLAHLVARIKHKRVLSAFFSNNPLFLNEKNGDEHTPIDIASMVGNWEAVKILIKHGANLDLSYLEGGYITSMAILKKNYSLLEMLLDDNSDFQVDINGWTPLMLSALNDCFNCIDVVLDKGADINFSLMSASPLSIAASNKSYKSVKRLLDKGAIKDSTDEQGKSPLSIAVENQDSEMINLLVSGGASVNFQNKEGRTALFFAYPEVTEKELSEYPGNKEIISLLHTLGANPEITASNGLSAEEEYRQQRAELLVRIQQEKERQEWLRKVAEARKARIAELKWRNEQQRRLIRQEEKRNGFDWGAFATATSAFIASKGYELDYKTQRKVMAKITQASSHQSNSPEIHERFRENFRKSVNNSKKQYEQDIKQIREIGAVSVNSEHSMGAKTSVASTQNKGNEYHKKNDSYSSGVTRNSRTQKDTKTGNSADHSTASSYETVQPSTKQKEKQIRGKYQRLWDTHDIGVNITKSDWDAGHSKSGALNLAKTMAKNKLSSACRARGYDSYESNTFVYHNQSCSTHQYKSGKTCETCYKCTGTGRGVCYTSGYPDDINGTKMEGVNGNVTTQRP